MNQERGSTLKICSVTERLDAMRLAGDLAERHRAGVVSDEGVVIAVLNVAN